MILSRFNKRMEESLQNNCNVCVCLCLCLLAHDLVFQKNSLLISAQSILIFSFPRTSLSPSLLSLSLSSPELRLLLLGWKGVGKSSVGNSILGRRYFESGQETDLCLRRQALVSGRRVTIVDTPGWDWFSVGRTPKRIRQESQRGAALLRPGPHTLLLVLPVVSSLTARKRRTLLSHLETLFGENACLHTMVLFSCGDWLGRTPIEDHILRGGRELQRLLEYCGNYYHVLDSKTPGKDRSVSVLLDKIEEMIRENGDKAFLPIQIEWRKS